MRQLADRLPCRMLSAAIRDVRARAAGQQKDLNATWRALFQLVWDPCHWNVLVHQKDNFYTSMFKSTTWRLQKKFVVLFHVIPNDSYCDEAADVMLALAHKRSDPAHPNQPTLPPQVRPEIGTAPLHKNPTLPTSRPVSNSCQQRTKTNISYTNWSPTWDADDCARRASPNGTPSPGRQSVIWTTPMDHWTEGDSKNSAAAWFTPDSLPPLVWDPEISEFSSLSGHSDLLQALDLAFIQSPVMDHSNNWIRLIVALWTLCTLKRCWKGQLAQSPRLKGSEVAAACGGWIVPFWQGSNFCDVTYAKDTGHVTSIFSIAQCKRYRSCDKHLLHCAMQKILVT